MRGFWKTSAGAAATVVAVGITAVVAVAVPPRDGPPAAAVDTAATPGAITAAEVTLITGDRVRVITAPGGQQSAITERRYSRPGVSYFERAIPGPGHKPDLVIIPSDAAGMIGSGVLDENLFDVSELVRDGYGNAARSTLPLIFTYRLVNAPAYAPTAHGMAIITRDLPSINGTAVSESKASAAQFWSSLTRPAASRNGPLTLDPRVAKVWLDGKVQVTGSASAATPAQAAAPQTAAAAEAVRAPQAAPGAGTGPGVLVADLDTGYDPAHPDLKGVVAAAQDFTGSADGTADGFGHGTWTASIIAGSGAASGGWYHGVAPGARLLIGKVLDDTGSGTDSQIIDGMQWAVAQHARIINMSLGAFDPTICQDGTDPLSQAVDSLSASSGTLFAVAAGNDGQAGISSLSAPGVATAALTVGAVDSGGTLAFFSSTGPRCGDDAVKPDVTAPGVTVVGARAAGTSIGEDDGINGDGPVNAYYTRASGTSASTPYASGAAAVLAQEHPDWNGAQLKAALMSSAAPARGTSAYDQGDGQLDLARAAVQAAYATPGSVSALLPWPHTTPAAMTVAYRNQGAAPLILNLGLAVTGPGGKPAPAGMFTISTSSVTVASGGTVKVEVTVDPARRPVGLYNGWVTATSLDRTTVLRTAVGVEIQPQLETVTFNAIDRNGQAVPAADLTSRMGVVDLATGKQAFPQVSPSGAATVVLPAGDYDFVAGVFNSATTGNAATLIDEPDVAVSHDMTVTFDARRGAEVAAILDRPVGDRFIVAVVGETVAGVPLSFGVVGGSGDTVYAVPTARVTGRPYAFLAGLQYDNAPPDPLRLGKATITYSLQFLTSGRIPSLLTHRVHDSALAVLRPVFRQQGKSMGFVDESHYAQGAALAPFLFSGSEFIVPASGSSTTEYMSPGSWLTIGAVLYGPEANLGYAWQEEGPVDTYRAGRTYTDTWGSAALGVAGVTTRLGDEISPDILPDSASAPQHIDADQLLDGLTGTVTLSSGGTVIGTDSILNQAPFIPLPPGRARYTLSASQQRSVPWSTLATTASASWTFSSGHVSGNTPATLPLWDVRISGAFNTLDHAPAGQPFPLTVAPDLPAGAPQARITSITVSASFDDGKTWHPLVLRTDGQGKWTTTVIPPNRAAFVSLSASLTDAAGNSTQQTVIRAYQL